MPEHVTIDELEKRFAGFIHLRRRTMHRYFQSIGMFNGHPHLLFHIRRQPGITPKELAEHMEIAPATVAVSIKRLEAAGLVSRASDDKDKRVTHLHLTDEGVRMDEECRRGRDFMMNTLYQGLTPAQQDTLYDLLGKMHENLQTGYDTLPDAAQQKG